MYLRSKSKLKVYRAIIPQSITTYGPESRVAFTRIKWDDSDSWGEYIGSILWKTHTDRMPNQNVWQHVIFINRLWEVYKNQKDRAELSLSETK